MTKVVCGRNVQIEWNIKPKNLPQISGCRLGVGSCSWIFSPCFQVEDLWSWVSDHKFWDLGHYKVWQILQNVTIITNWLVTSSFLLTWKHLFRRWLFSTFFMESFRTNLKKRILLERKYHYSYISLPM